MSHEPIFTRLDREVVELAKKCGSYLDAIKTKIEELGLDVSEADELFHPLIIKKLEEELYELNLLKKDKNDSERKANLFMFIQDDST